MKIHKDNSTGMYKLDVRMAGRRRRTTYSTRSKAEAALREVKRSQKSYGDMFARYPEATRIEWVMAHELAKEGGFSLMEAASFYKDRVDMREETRATLGTSIRAFLREKQKLVKERSYRSLSSTLERFGEPRWNGSLGDECRSSILEWLNEGQTRQKSPWSSRTKNSYLTDLKNFFNWTVAEGHLDASPAQHIRRFRSSDAELAKDEEAKKILTPDEVEELMRYLEESEPDMVCRAALLFFAGVRPEREAATISFDEVLMDDELVHVRASRAKDRQNRYIPIAPNLLEWLDWGLSNGASLPVDNWDKRWLKARTKLNLTGEAWPHDATRHSFASYHLALHGDDATRKALGHGNFEMLFRNYRTLVRTDDAERYFSICPGE
jgi:integrase